jgi:uncharacterized protein YdcH (DUF465 family)
MNFATIHGGRTLDPAFPFLEVHRMKRTGSLHIGLEHQRTSIEAQHRMLDERLQELGRRAILTPREQLEIAELKKHKLRAKDELAALYRAR